MRPNVVSGQAIGTSIAVANSADLAFLDTQGLSVGTQVYNIGVGSYFTLTRSSDALIPDQIVAVFGISDMRWVLYNANPFPPFGPGIVVYVSAAGNDTGNNGLSWATAFKTLDKALTVLESAGGGELHVFSQSGEVTGNIWLRGDGVSIAGWHGDFPLKVYGYGNQHWSFGFAAAKIAGGSSTDRLTPQIWLAGTFQPKEFHDIAPGSFCNQFVREWDYRRNVDGSIQYENVTSWVRSGTSATVTLALPPAYNVDSVTRPSGSNIVTMTYTLPRRNMGRMRIGQVIRVASSDPHFDSGDFVVLSVPLAGTTIQLTYAQTTSAGGPFTGAAGVTVQSSDIGIGDRIEFTTNQPLNVPTSAFLVTNIGNTGTVNANVITVSDVYGGHTIGDVGGNNPIGTFPASGTFSDPGTWVIQDRYNYRTSTIDWYNIQGSGRGAPPYDNQLAGPNIDIGGMDDGRQRFFRCSPGIYLPVHGCPDPDRTCFALLDPGSNGSSGGDWYNCRPAGVGLRRFASRDTTDSMRITDMLANNGYGTPTAPPCVEIINGSAMTLFIDGVFVADRQTLDTTPDVRIDACAPQSVIQNSTTVEGPVCVGGNTGDSIRSGWTLGQSGFYKAGSYASLAGSIPHTRRNLPLAMCRYPNLVPATGSWVLNGGSITTGIADNWGKTHAIRVAGTTDVYMLQSSPVTITAGDVFVVGGWFRKAGGIGSSSVVNFSIVDNLGSRFAQVFLTGLPGDGEWHPLSARVIIPTLAGSSWTIDYGFPGGAVSGGGIEVDRPFLEHVTVASASLNEANEYAGTIGNRTRTLTPGTAGTLEDIPFVASGGVGISTSITRTVGVGSGQLTLGAVLEYEPRLADDGLTIIGWCPIYSATVNP